MMQLLLLQLLALALAASSYTQTIGPSVNFLHLGANAVCGPPVSGHTLICFDPAVPVPIGFGALLQVSPANLTLTSGTIAITLTSSGAIAVNGATPGQPGTVTLSGRTANFVDGVWLVRRETLLSPIGKVQDVCVVGTSVCGLRLVLSVSDPSIAVLEGDKVVIDDNISLPVVLAALSSDTIHVVSGKSIFSATQGSQLVVPEDVPSDGTVSFVLRVFDGASTCGNALYRQVCSPA